MSIIRIVPGKPMPFHGSRSTPAGVYASGRGLSLFDEGQSKLGSVLRCRKSPIPIDYSLKTHKKEAQHESHSLRQSDP